MDLTDLLKNSGVLDQLAGQFGVEDNKVEEVVKGIVPELSQNINNNTSDKEGLKSFWDALDNHKDDPIEDMLADVNNVDTEDGDKILGHILGDRRAEVEETLSQKQGLSAGAVGGIMKFLAPMLMGMLAKNIFQPKAQPQERQAVDSKKIDSSMIDSSMVDSILGGDSAVSKMAKVFIDKNKDGSIFDDLLGKFLGK